jgi:hypothetical protein
VTASEPRKPRHRRRRPGPSNQQRTGSGAEARQDPQEPIKRAQGKRAAGKREPGERGLRDLIGAGPSQLGVSGALRGRDVNRPTDQDLAEAERDTVIVRRHWTPPE